MQNLDTHPKSTQSVQVLQVIHAHTKVKQFGSIRFGGYHPTSPSPGSPSKLFTSLI